MTRKLSLNALGSGVATELEKYANDYIFKYFTQNEATILTSSSSCSSNMKKKKMINELQIFITKVMTTQVEKNLYFKRKNQP